MMNLTQRREDAITPLRRSERLNTENEIARRIVDAAFHIHKAPGPGLLESVYEIVLNGLTFDEGFRADLIAEDRVIVELKSVEQIAPVHQEQLLTCLRLADKRPGLLLNFGAAVMKDGTCRIVNGLPE